MKGRVRAILRDLEAVRENLLALSDDIWLEIDHNDSESLEEGYQFKKDYNEKMRTFDHISHEISAMIQQFMDVNVEEETVQGQKSKEDNERIIRELNKEEPHTLDEDFAYKRPYGFVLEGQAFTDVITWRRLYEVFLKQLEMKNHTLFNNLSQNKEFVSRRGNKAFSDNPDDFHVALQLNDRFYAEGNLSANQIRKNMKKLLHVFAISSEKCVIYLREDRNSEE
ncbi:hypothetical protein JQN58_12720 [Aneurinibacillus sp. BA2021]|nr:hypothetical protein [Aneurinibacillus sp. BA2021]